MNREEYNKLSTFEKIDFDIAMRLYDEHNSKIASINDHLGDIFDYRDLQEAKECELQDEIRMYRDALKEKCDALKEKCDAIDKAIEYMKESMNNPLKYEWGVLKHTLEILKGEDNE